MTFRATRLVATAILSLSITAAAAHAASLTRDGVKRVVD